MDPLGAAKNQNAPIRTTFQLQTTATLGSLHYTYWWAITKIYIQVCSEPELGPETLGEGVEFKLTRIIINLQLKLLY